MPFVEDKKIESLLSEVKSWPTQPGIYMMKDEGSRILYVGKAKNLKSRIRSYFAKKGLSRKTRQLVKNIQSIEFTVTHTELEALLLECNLIKKHKPRYNVRLKDDKSFPYFALSFTHPFPQFFVTRKISLSPKIKYFGPYSAGVREIERFLLKTFQLRDCSDSKFNNRTRPCLNYEIGTCTAPCVDYVTQDGYNKQIKEATLFLRGKKQELLTTFKNEMAIASEKQEYEIAKTLRDKIRAVKKITARQDAVLTERMKDIDIIGCFLAEEELCIAILFIRGGFLTGRKISTVSLTLDSSEETIRTFLAQYYSNALIPDEVWLAADFEGRAILEKFLRQKSEKKVLIRIPRSEKPLRLLGMAYENAKLIYQQEKDKKKDIASEELKKVLDLKEIPHSIEGIDVSNFQGKLPAVALVHFTDERPNKSRYRLYYPKTVEGPNDFAMIYEIVKRRFSKLEENPPPDLLLIDGGKGQLSSAVKALNDIGVSIPVCSLAKARTESAFTLKEVKRTQDRVFIPNRSNPLALREGSPALRLLQQVRDEAHRFSIESHRRRRNKETFEESTLTDIKGIGNKTRIKLLKYFGSLEKIKEATLDDLILAGLSKVQARKLNLSEEE